MFKVNSTKSLLCIPKETTLLMSLQLDVPASLLLTANKINTVKIYNRKLEEVLQNFYKVCHIIFHF